MSVPDKLLINLRILGNVQKNGRIARSYDGIIAIEDETYYQSFKRFLTNDSRRQAIQEIASIMNEKSITISPNPAVNILSITNVKEFTQISIIDELGKIVLKKDNDE